MQKYLFVLFLPSLIFVLFNFILSTLSPVLIVCCRCRLYITRIKRLFPHIVHLVIVFVHQINTGFPFRSPSLSTMRDIDPKLPAARHNIDGYPLSDGDWPSHDRYVLTWTEPQPGRGRETASISLTVCICSSIPSVMACLRHFPQRVTLSWWSGPQRACSEPSPTCSGPGGSSQKPPG